MIPRGLLTLLLLTALAACGSPSASPSTPTTVSTPPATSTSAFPTAKDGQNYKACSDGNCEVLIHKAASFTISGEKIKATVTDGTLKLTSPTGYVSMSGSGYSSWSNGGPTHTATLKAATADTAILILKTS